MEMIESPEPNADQKPESFAVPTPEEFEAGIAFVQSEKQNKSKPVAARPAYDTNDNSAYFASDDVVNRSEFRQFE
jgi:hypothetical protein